MATKQSTVEYILDQIAEAGAVTAKKMFGEYGVYCDGKMVALVCDDQLFVKQTPAGKAFLGDCPEKPPYPGATPCFLISGEKWDERAWLSHVIKVSAAQAPAPKKKQPRTPR